MAAADVARDELGEARLVGVGIAGEAHRERVDPGPRLRGERRDQRAVEAAREENADRHVGDEARADRGVERGAQRVVLRGW